MHRLTSSLILAGFALVAWPRPAAAFFGSSSSREVDVVVDMTPEGRKLAHPDAKHPAFYYPVVAGFKEWGATVAGEKQPNPKDLIHLMAVELAKQGYFVWNPKRPKPDLIIVLHWGAMNPEIDDSDPTDPSSRIFFNQNQMLALVGGNTLNNLDLSFEREDVMQAAEEDRYFIVVTAYDFAAYEQHHAEKSDRRKKLVLWQAKMSVPSNGVYFPDVMKTLAKAGGPFLGRETVRPKMLLTPILPEGRIDIGTPTVKDYLDAPPPATSRSISTPASK